jgi:cytochrome c oxidase subunit 2
LKREVSAAQLRLRRRATALATAALLALSVSLIATPVALANFITPKAGGSPNADSIANLYNLILVLAIIVFAIVEGALVYSVYKFRAKRGALAAQIHGNTPLEIGWTVAAALILVIITTITFIKLPGIINPPNSSRNAALTAALGVPTPPNNKPLVICVQSRQFIFRYSYGTGCKNDAFSGKLPYSYTDMVVPAGTTVQLVIQSSDVIHSWWIPSLGGKVDAVPGYTTYTWFKAPHAGSTYIGHCAQLCGREHYAMLARVRVVTPAQYLEWISRQKAAIARANAQVTQLRQILTSNGNL